MDHRPICQHCGRPIEPTDRGRGWQHCAHDGYEPHLLCATDDEWHRVAEPA